MNPSSFSSRLILSKKCCHLSLGALICKTRMTREPPMGLTLRMERELI